MANTHVFPQTGDNDDAENFAQMIGHSILSDYVRTGMGFSPDYTNVQVTIGDGVAFIATPSSTASSTGETRLETNHVVQVAQDTIALTDSAVNHIYVEPNLGTDDSASYAAYTDETNASANALKIGEVDTSNNTSTELNRDVNVNVTLRVNGSEVWHTGNDGDGSGLHADLLDGQHASEIGRTNEEIEQVAEAVNHFHGWMNF